ncbi:glucose dehydrogenase [FAD, quinone]-like, partial [Parasteatoda tepidariorum]|uniref:glucose dehydrogenase [FAD, quinone]-like n=1 Tax=Parasteatoda tepidariorum TaxID=114398 RepID=UPI001C7260A0
YLASPEGVIALAFLKDSYIRPKIDFPNYELYFFLGSAADLKRNFNIQEYALDQIFAPYENKTFLTCFASVIQPKSRGYVKLLSSNPEDPPLIDPNYFANPQDLKDMVEGMKTCHRIAMTKPLQNVGARPFQTVYPGCEKYLGNTDGYFACQAGSIVTTMSHAVGTAKMGAINDPSTVVDPELK